jgi:methionyl-tRNA formyltransferase
MSAVKKFALSKNLPILQPEKLKSPEFIENLKSYNADLFVVVAFRMLPEIVWSMPPLGTINLHGSLLPNYRGAAPINWAVINGEKETGVTTFFIEKEIDTGKIIDKETICITDKDTAGSVHDKLMQVGAKLLAKTVKNILNGSVKAIPQTDLDLSAIKHAPKIFKPDCKLDWSKDSLSVYNKIRGLSPYPTAWTVVENKEDQSRKTIKLFEVDYIIDNQNNSYQIKIEHKKVMFGTANGWIILKDVQLEGKKRMPIEALMNGFDFTKYNLLNE